MKLSTTAPSALRILHVTTVHGPLDGRIYYKEVLALASAGYSVRLATTVQTQEQHGGIVLIPLGARGGSRWRRLIRDARAMALMLRQSKTIIHIHDPELLISALLPALIGRTLVYDVHEFYLERIAVSHWIPTFLRGPVTKLYDALERFILSHFSGVVIVSEAMRERYRGMIGDDRIALVRNFPYIAHGEAELARATEHPLGGRPYVLHTGGAMHLRAFHIMVGAAEYLRENGCDWPIVNLGPIDLSAYEPDEREALTRRGIAADVRNLGFVGQAEAWRYVAHADIAYMPLIVTENNVRGMPNKLFEYLYFGLPIIATDIGRIAEIVRQTGAGILVPPEDAAEDGKALSLLANDSNLRERYRSESARAGSAFTFAGEFERLAQLYARIEQNL